MTIIYDCEDFREEFLAALHASTLPAFRAKWRRGVTCSFVNAATLDPLPATCIEFDNTIDSIENRGGRVHVLRGQTC